MKISIDWLSDFVDLAGIRPEQLAEELTVRTAEVEGWEVVRRNVAGVLIGEVTRVSPITDKLRAVTVELGGRTAESVCGAPNVRVGLKAAFAPAGTRLNGGKIVEVATLHDHKSEGVLCSPAELGMSTAHEGLLEIPSDLPNGAALADHVPAEDVLVEIDNKSLTHRPDLWGHYGFAREFAAIFNRPLAPYEIPDLGAYADLPAYPIEVESAEDCPVYTAMEIAVGSNPPSPLVMQRRLHALGQSTKNVLVDVTNYVQLELGQPTHAFDAARVSRIRVARAGKPGKFTTLDGKSWSLLPEDLLISNEAEPVALAGIMGGHGSQVSPDTRRILLESANFKGSRVRLTSVRLALRTDSSLRFEKKLPPLFTKLAAGRILGWLSRAGLSPAPTSRYTVVGDLKENHRHITLPPGYIARRAGAPLDDATTTRILTSIGFGVEPTDEGGLRVAVPPFRSGFDISIPEDISEEVMRLYGYDQIPPKLPAVPTASAPLHLPSRNQHRMRRILSQGHGFVEVQTYGWLADDWTAAIGYSTGPTLDVRNPIAVNRRRMRDALLPNVLAVANGNRKLRESFRVYELGRVFHLAADGTKSEADELAGVSVDQAGALTAERHFRAVRGAIDDLVVASGHPPLDGALETNLSPVPWMAPGAVVALRLRDQVVGHLGLLPEALRKKVIDAGHAVWFSLRVNALAGAVYPSVDYQSPPIYPGSWQDFTLVWPVARGYRELAAILDGFADHIIERRTLIDFYRAKNSDTGNYSFRFFLRLPERTLTADDIEKFRSALLAYLTARELKLV